MSDIIFNFLSIKKPFNIKGLKSLLYFKITKWAFHLVKKDYIDAHDLN